MRKNVLKVIGLALLMSGAAGAQILDNSSLSGKYYFVQLLVTVSTSSGLPTNASNLGGAITFDGNGGYSFTGNLGTGTKSASNTSGSGAYSVAGDGSVTFPDPIRNDLAVAARLSGDQMVLVGSSTEAKSNDDAADIFVAIKAPVSGISNATLNGNYVGSTMALPNGTINLLSSSLLTFAANGSGGISAQVLGHEFDQYDYNFGQSISNATYSVSADGSGTANFGSSARLLNGGKTIFVSQDGNYVLGFSTGAGARDIFLATKSFSSLAQTANFNGRYWIAELDYDDYSGSLSSASGAFQAFGNNSSIVSEHLHTDGGPFDYSALYYYSVNPSSLGQFTNAPQSNLLNMGLGAPTSVSGTVVPGAAVGGQVGLINLQTTYYGVFFAVLAPMASGTGVFLDPAGIVNGATFASSPHSLAPGDIVSLFGSGLSPTTDLASAVPLPTTLDNVSVTVNGIKAPLFYVSPTQINIQIPYEVAGSASAVFQVTNGSTQSNAVTVPLSATDPAIFMWADAADIYHAVVLHTDFTLVTTQNPAHPGETVLIYATGLGTLNPPVSTGDTNPTSAPLAAAVDSHINVYFYYEAATSVSFAGGAPGFVGLNQLNVVIPADVVTGPAVPLSIGSSTGYSAIADIAISK